MKITKEYLNKSGIYCIINIKNKKRYIGSSKNIYQRLLKHRSLLRNNKHDNKKIQNSWNKHSEENFDFYILTLCDENDLIVNEQYYIDILKPEYNITLIVERNILSKESRILQSNTRKERIASGEIKSHGKIIYQYDLEGNFIEKFDHIKKACIKNNIHQSTICRFLNGTYKKGGNYLWSLEYKEKLEPYVKNKKDNSFRNKKIELLDYYTNEKCFEFDSLKDCAEYFDMTTSCISGAIRNNSKFIKKYMIKIITA